MEQETAFISKTGEKISRRQNTISLICLGLGLSFLITGVDNRIAIPLLFLGGLGQLVQVL